MFQQKHVEVGPRSIQPSVRPVRANNGRGKETTQGIYFSGYKTHIICTYIKLAGILECRYYTVLLLPPLGPSATSPRGQKQHLKRASR